MTDDASDELQSSEWTIIIVSWAIFLVILVLAVSLIIYLRKKNAASIVQMTEKHQSVSFRD